MGQGCCKQTGDSMLEKTKRPKNERPSAARNQKNGQKCEKCKKAGNQGSNP